MDTKRLVLFALLFAVGFNLYQAWQRDYPPHDQTQQMVATVQQHNTSGQLLPVDLDDTSVNNTQNSTTQPSVNDIQRLSKLPRITIENDVVKLEVDVDRGEIVSAHLLKYAKSDQDHHPFQLLMDNQRRYIAASNIYERSDDGRAITIGHHFTAPQKKYLLAQGQDEVKAVLTSKTNDGLIITKTFALKRGKYLVSVDDHVTNYSNQSRNLRFSTQLLQLNPLDDKSSMFHVGSYTGVSISDPTAKLYEKLPFKTIKQEDLSRKVTGGWVAMQQHYFLSAWVPPSSSTNTFYSRYVDDQYVIGIASPPVVVRSEGNTTFSAKLYLGPEITSVLKQVAPGLDLTVDYGILSVISSFIFKIMSLIHQLIGNWGWSIVLVTVAIKLAFYQLSAKSYRSMAMMRQLQPKLAAIKQRCGDDKARLSQETMALYRQEKINPLGGCLPIIIQIPVFISLYWVLIESVELRQAPWILWVNDLSEPDPYYILPVIMGLTMFIQQRLSPTPPDPAQAKMMMLLPVFFTFLFSHFPSGLVLYWTVNNTLSIIQQWVISKRFDGKGKKKKDLTRLVAANES